jgi:tetratricopeptide (TPR) repeat protein
MGSRVILLVAIALVPGLSPLAGQTPRLPPLPTLDVQKLPTETQRQVQEAYDAALRHPDDAAAAGKLGMLLDLYNRPEAALLCYQRAHQQAPRAFQWLYFWGALLLRNKQRVEAVPVLKKGLQLRPDYMPAQFKLAEALVETAQVEEAREIYEAILKKFPDSAEAHYGLGRVYAAQGDTRVAVELYNQACKLFPTYGPAHYALTLAYRKLGQNEKAEEQLRLYEQSKNIVPPLDDPLRDEMRELDSSAVSYLQRGVFLEQVGRTEDAIKATEKAVELDPKLVLAHANLLSLYGRVGNFRKAEEQYRAVMALTSDKFPKAHYDYGVLLMIKGNYKGAEEALRRAIQINPSYAQAHNNLGYVLEHAGHLAEAMAEYRKSIQSMPGFRQAHFNLGRILVNQREYQEGIEQFLQILTPADESTPAYLYALGAAYGRAGDRPNALRYLHEAQQQASARGQSRLLASIEKDLRALEGPEDSR